MNIMIVKDKIRNISKEKDVDFNSAFRVYIYDRFIERLAVSDYKDNFIIKGGFYLSTLFGVENRRTMDIDTALKKISLNLDNLNRIISNIINIDIHDGAILELEGFSIIRDEDEL